MKRLAGLWEAVRRLSCVGFVVFLWFGPTRADTSVQLVPIISGLTNPLSVTHSRDGSGRLFIVEQAGRILIFQQGALLSPPFLDIRNRVNSGGEKGLLGVAFHPDFKNNGRFFVNYTRLEGNQLESVIGEYQASMDPNVADPEEKVILQFSQPFVNHNGGHLAFGPDGCLYIGTGDGGSGGDPQGNGQNRDTLLGKILRIDVDRGSPYVIPLNNPFVGQSNVREEIWAYGFRNPWRFSFDRSSGRLFVGDVGQNAREEIDLVIKGGNYGWKITEGSHCFPPDVTNCDTSGLQPPISDYGRLEGSSVTGGYVYRGSQSTLLRGAYIFGDFVSTRIWVLEETISGAWKRTELIRAGFPISSFGEDEAGELYVVDYGAGGSTGAVYRVQFDFRDAFAQIGDGIASAGIFQSTLIIVNHSDQMVTGEVFFYASSGSPLLLTVNGVTGSRFPFALAAKSSRAFVTSGASNPVVVGWAEVLSNAPITGAILFTLQALSGEPIAEAGLGVSRKGKEFAAHVFRGAAFDTNTGVALANPSDTEMALVSFTVKDTSGVSTGDFILGPREHAARFLHELGSVPADFEGTLFITSTRDIICTLLRTKKGILLSSLPVAK